MLYVLICGHKNPAPELAFVLACGSLMQFRMRILSTASLASAFVMSTLRPWPQHCFAAAHDPSAFFTERFARSKSMLPVCLTVYDTEKKDPSKKRKRSPLGFYT